MRTISLSLSLLSSTPTTPLRLEELEALPVGSVVRDGSGLIFNRGPDGEGDVVWWFDGDPEDASVIALPARVLYRPTTSGDADV
jgi:hypothetical protein